jgi:predicted HTH domain antitoxin
MLGEYVTISINVISCLSTGFNKVTVMTIETNAITPEKVLELAQSLSPADLRWLREQLDQLLVEEEAPLPEQATLEEAIELFLANKCSLGRAAELAGASRWDILDILKERGIPIYMGDTDMDPAEMERQIERLEAMDVL